MPRPGTTKRARCPHGRRHGCLECDGFKVIGVSMYGADIDRCDMLVGTLRRRGDSSANRSRLIRDAVEAYAITIGSAGAPDNGVDGEGSR